MMFSTPLLSSCSRHVLTRWKGLPPPLSCLRLLSSSASAFAASAVDLASIKELREKSGAPISDVKAALQAANGQMDAAFDELRKRGLAASRKKAGRAATEGVVAIATESDGSAAAVVELNSETDFVARNDKFISLARSLAQHALAQTPEGHVGELDAEALRASTITGGNQTVADTVIEVAATVRENLQFRRAWAARLSGSSLISTYVHGKIEPDIGRIASVVALSPEADASASADNALALAKDLAMHACAVKPLYVRESDVPQAVLDAERAIYVEKAIADGKNPDRAEKVADKSMKKYAEDICLLNQKFVKDMSKTVSAVLKSDAKGWSLENFGRIEVGEGMEKASTDFAAEVAKTVADSAK